MDYDFNNVLDLLRNGADAEDICSAFADQVNDAIAIVDFEDNSDEIYGNLADAWNAAIDFYIEHNDVDFDANEVYFDVNDAEDLIKSIIEILLFSKKLRTFVKDTGEQAKDNFSDTMDKFFNCLFIS